MARNLDQGIQSARGSKQPARQLAARRSSISER